VRDDAKQLPLVERLVIENALDAAEHGALVLNHARAVRFLGTPGDRVEGAVVRDELDGEEITVRARLTVNATGPWLDITNAGLRAGLPGVLRLTKGVHLVTPRAVRCAHVLFAGADDRLFFVLPWLGFTLVGTTDTPVAEAAVEDRGDGGVSVRRVSARPGVAALTRATCRSTTQPASR